MQNIPFLFIINDGWGVALNTRGNAITQANIPTFHHLIKNYWVTTLQSSGEAVGLPWGEMGNSEVGHLSLGSGKIIYQDLPRITRSISDGSFFNNEKFLKAIEKVKQSQGVLHFAGLVSDGGVHSHIEHLDALLELSATKGVQKVVVHCFLDGRDTTYNSGVGFVEDILARIEQYKLQGVIGSVSGRYYAMDRDNRWDRIKAAYDAIVHAQSEKTFPSAIEAIKQYYSKEVFDEQIPPTVISPSSPITSNDSLVIFNFRADRARQITSALALPEFNKFSRGNFLKDLYLVTMTEYEKALPVEVAFPPEKITVPLSKVLSDAGVKQLHIAETEKYAHVTYFFNGGKEEAYPGEKRVLIPSQQQVKSYDETPQMSAPQIADRLISEIQNEQYQFYVVNFANADMVGHTGNMKATVQAVQFLDSIMKHLVEAILVKNGTVLITADHGNAETMFDPQTGEINKEHTSNPVPCIIIGRNFVQQKTEVPDLSAYIPHGVLADVSPTILHIMGINIPQDMTGRSLLLGA